MARPDAICGACGNRYIEHHFEDGDCQVSLIRKEFNRLGCEPSVGMRVSVEVGDIHASLEFIATTTSDQEAGE